MSDLRQSVKKGKNVARKTISKYVFVVYCELNSVKLQISNTFLDKLFYFFLTSNTKMNFFERFRKTLDKYSKSLVGQVSLLLSEANATSFSSLLDARKSKFCDERKKVETARVCSSRPSRRPSRTTRLAPALVHFAFSAAKKRVSQMSSVTRKNVGFTTAPF